MDDDLGALLRRHRQDADLTIEDLAAASGVSDRGIGDIERGVSRLVSVDLQAAETLLAAE